MSGIEIAGLVLGGFPIVMSAWDMYKHHCEPFRDWMRFEQTLANLLRPVVREEVKFKMNLEELLLPIVDSQEDLEAMYSNPDDPRWKDPSLDKQLRLRLGNTYSIYFDHVEDMGRQLMKIRTVLHVEKGNTEWLTSPKANWSREYDRLVVCFKKVKTQKYATALEKDNEAISKLLGQEQNLVRMRQQKRSPVGNFLQKVRNAAINLHSALSKGWICQCAAPHSAILRLEPRPGVSKNTSRSSTRDEDLKFQVLFYHPQAIQTVTCVAWTETMVIAQTTSSTPAAVAPRSSSPLAEIQQKANAMSFGMKIQKKLAFASLPQKPVMPTPAPTIAAPISSNHITDLCHTLHIGIQNTCVGYISQDSSQYYLTAWRNHVLGQHPKALDKALASQSSNPADNLSIRQRMHLAVAVASNVLQLWGTPWLKPHLAKEDLQIWPTNQSMHAYVQAVFQGQQAQQPSQVASPPSQSTASRSREAMLKLAIVLLELCFGKIMESQPFRRNYLGPDGQPSDLTDRMTAVKWQESVMGELGEAYADVVSACLDCRFWLKEPNLEDPTFRQSVHANVVEPLQKMASAFG